MIYRKLTVVFLTLAVVGVAFAKDNLAILPFTGGTAEEGETIAELFSYSDELKAAWTLIPRTSITRAIGNEWKFQTDTGMTDPDTIMAIGKQLGAQYIVAGNITKLGALNLLVISILKIDDLRQVAGDIQTYARIGDIRGKLPDMARNIVAAAGADVSRLDKLAVTPLQLRGDVDAKVADTLAQFLSINLIRGGKYAVYPRTATLEQVQAEYDNQTDGMTADENIVGIGKGENPRFVLSVAARRLDEQNMFNASIINLESGEQIVGRSVDYQSLDDGITVMQRLARELTATLISLPLANSLEWIANNAVEGGSYLITLKNNETIEPQSLSYSGNKVNITLDGGTVERIIRLSSNGALFTVGSGVTLTLGNNVSLQGRRNNMDSLVYVNSEGTLAMESGSKISGNSKGGGGWGGGVFVSDGTFTMSGGEISGNSADESGGGVVVDGGTFTMSGGAISGNSANVGGGVVVVWGMFTMSGGIISANNAEVGGGVSVYDGMFTMHGGEISGNSASSGGGVFVEGGTFMLSNGEISGNSVYNSGSGVFVEGGTFTMSDGEISGNVGSGVVVRGGTFTMSGGAISGNDGRGVVVGGGTFTMSDGEISGNSADGGYGGGVYVGGTWASEGEWIAGTFTMSGGTISGNSANHGGGVMVEGGTFTLSGGDISGNSADIGGGVWIAGPWTSEDEEYAGGTFTKQAGGIIYGADASDTLKNTATEGDGHAVYVMLDESSGKQRNSTAGVGVRLDSARNGSAGGWEK
ncbi:MAG: penicillin-binding protein activator LpoB [Treponema sp.]|jgi:TolB-like protein|nr:penicillin-binding protein activator LpoB [Treponema sp.]